MNIQHRRFSAYLCIMLTIVLMIATLAFPVCAAEVTETFDEYRVPKVLVIEACLRVCNYPLLADSYYEMAEHIISTLGGNTNEKITVYVSQSTNYIIASCPLSFFVQQTYGGELHKESCSTFIESWEGEINKYYILNGLDLSGYSPRASLEMTGEYHFLESSQEGIISGVIDSSMFDNVLEQVLDLLPVAIPVLIGFIGLSKAISFITSIMHGA